MTDHKHSEPDHYGRCEGCGIRLESPSRWMRDKSEREGGTIVHMTKTITLPAGVALPPAVPTETPD